MKYAGYGLLILLGLVLQTGGSPGLIVYGFRPELMLLLALLFAMVQEQSGGATFGFFSGLAQDVLLGHFIGLYAGTFLLVALLVGSITKRLYKENFLVRFLIVFCGTAAGQILYLLGSASFGVSSSWAFDTWSMILGTSLFNGLLGLLLLRPFSAFNKRLVYLHELFKRAG